MSIYGLRCLFLPLLECLLAGECRIGMVVVLEAQFLCGEEEEKTKRVGEM